MRRTSAAFVAALAGLMLVGAPVLAKDWSADPPRIISSDSQTQKAWANRYLDQEDWMLAAYANGQFWLVSSETSAHVAYPLVQDWIRIEIGHPLDPKLPVASTLIQVEADCAKSGYRSLRFINYRGNNLRGAILGDAYAQESKLEAMAAGSIGAAVVSQICQDIRPPDPAP